MLARLREMIASDNCEWISS